MMQSIHGSRLSTRGNVAFLLFVPLGMAGGCGVQQNGFRSTFDVDKANLGPDGGNEFFSLEVGRRLVLEDGDFRVTITVLDETREVDGVTTRIVEEREEENGELVEVSRNFFAADSTTNDVYYFGEEVDDYENGQVVGHSGAWLSGVDGARFGLIMPGEVEVGDRYYQEIAPGVAQDRAEHLSIDDTVVTPAGTFMNCLHVEETSALEVGTSDKWYCPNIGLVQDDDAVLAQAVAPIPKSRR